MLCTTYSDIFDTVNIVKNLFISMKGSNNTMTLEDIRKKIDETDKELFRLFEQRMKLAKEVAEAKIISGDNVYKPIREEEVIEKFAENAPDDMKQYYKAFIRRVMLISREYQYRIIYGGNDSNEKSSNEYSEQCAGETTRISFKFTDGIPDGIIGALADSGVKVEEFNAGKGSYSIVLRNDISGENMKALLALIDNESIG